MQVKFAGSNFFSAFLSFLFSCRKHLIAIRKLFL